MLCPASGPSQRPPLGLPDRACTRTITDSLSPPSVSRRPRFCTEASRTTSRYSKSGRPSGGRKASLSRPATSARQDHAVPEAAPTVRSDDVHRADPQPVPVGRGAAARGAPQFRHRLEGCAEERPARDRQQARSWSRTLDDFLPSLVPLHGSAVLIIDEASTSRPTCSKRSVSCRTSRPTTRSSCRW